MSLFPVSWLFWPVQLYDNQNTCCFRLITSKPCPFCGLTRAFASAIHGDFRSAFVYHWFWWLAVIILVIGGFILIFDGITGTRRTEKILEMASPIKYFIIFILIIFMLYRF
ncbi:DUF2752 domain-containing protein [Thermodesulfobacteriota bacterium]